eukprot:3482324-Prymnesium_polylepis.1
MSDVDEAVERLVGVAVEAEVGDTEGDHVTMHVGILLVEPRQQLGLLDERGNLGGDGRRLFLGEEGLAARQDLGFDALRDGVGDGAVALREAVLVEVAGADAAHDAVDLVVGAWWSVPSQLWHPHWSGDTCRLVLMGHRPSC